jgi:hypothetical protein
MPVVAMRLTIPIVLLPFASLVEHTEGGQDRQALYRRNGQHSVHFWLRRREVHQCGRFLGAARHQPYRQVGNPGIRDAGPAIRMPC